MLISKLSTLVRARWQELLCSRGKHRWTVKDHSSACTPIRRGPMVRWCSCGGHQVYNFKAERWESRQARSRGLGEKQLC